MNLFTVEEKENIAKEFTYYDRINRNKAQNDGNQTSTIDSDWFTEQNIDSTQNELTKNITSKSVILAPFNSTLTERSDCHDDSTEKLMLEKKVLKLGAKVREVDRQYEKNNNCEVDNGVYNKCVTMTSKTENSELNPLASNEQSIKDDDENSGHRHDSPHHGMEKGAVQKLLLSSLAPQPLVISNIKNSNNL